ncbi:hypothetical protein PTKU15_88170 [Paraburkholderia terrae]|nr:hypothetical protein PTKU15_88170 [Paraburkholderia terrae]
MAEIVAHQAQVDLLVGHVRPGGVPQPVRRALFEQVGARRKGLATFAQPTGGTRKDILDDRVQRGAGGALKTLGFQRRAPRIPAIMAAGVGDENHNSRRDHH